MYFKSHALTISVCVLFQSENLIEDGDDISKKVNMPIFLFSSIL